MRGSSQGLTDEFRSWLLACGCELLELFCSVQDHAHFVRRPICRMCLHKKKSLTVWAYVVVGVARATHQTWRDVREDSWSGRAEGGVVVTPTLMSLPELI